MKPAAQIFKQGDRVLDWLITQEPTGEPDSVRGLLLFSRDVVVTTVEGVGHYMFALDGGSPCMAISGARAIELRSINERVFVAVAGVCFTAPTEPAA